MLTGTLPPADFLNFSPVRGMDAVGEATVDIGGKQLKVAVVYGTGSAAKLIERIKSGESEYLAVEVMTCPGGCIGGGGQPKKYFRKGDAARSARIESLYKRDSSMSVRVSADNPEIKALYKEYLGSPLSDIAERLLHTSYIDRSPDLGK